MVLNKSEPGTMQYRRLMNRSLFTTHNPVLLQNRRAGVGRRKFACDRSQRVHVQVKSFRLPPAPRPHAGNWKTFFSFGRSAWRTPWGQKETEALNIRRDGLYVTYFDRHVSNVPFIYLHLGLNCVLVKWVSLTYFFISFNMYCFL